LAEYNYQMNNYDWLLERLDAFIRKYYANKVIRGALVFLISFLFYVLTVTVGEYYLYMPVWSRITVLSVFIVLGLSALVAWVIIPLAQMGKLGKVISHEQAAQIIGRHFPEISDRLLNILQLKKHPDNNASRELAEASINQKISQISVVPITRAVDLSKNRKYLPYLLPLLLVAVFILVAAPNVFKESTSRLLQPTKVFEKPSPFQFIISNPSLIAIRNSDFVVTVITKGSALPAEAYIQMGKERVPMQPLDNHSFQYTFKNVTEPVTFRFFGARFYSSENTLQVVQRPVLKSFRVQVNYPAYTGKKNEVRNSLSDMTLPAGTTLNWSFVTDHTGAATIHFGNGAPVALRQPSNSKFEYDYRFLNDTAYTITLHNKEATVADSYRYQVQVIPDQYPVIQLQQVKDTVSGKQVVITGTAGDDYGITRVSFNYEVSDKNKAVLKKSMPLKIAPGAMVTFQQYFDIQSLNLLPGQKLSYYIEAWDNDGVHGSKASRSEVMAFFMYNDKQIDSAINENSRQINSGISNSASKTQQLQNDYKEMQTKMLQSENLDWDQQQSLQDMLKQQMNLKTQVENIKQRFEEQMQQSEQKKYSDNIKEKQKDLDKQLENLLSNELKEEMKKLQELMQKLNKEQAVNAMQQMQQDNKLFKMDMERMQELMKKLEMQMHMEDMANKLDDLAKKENELENKTDKADKESQASPGSQKEKENEKTSQALSKEQKDIKAQLEKAMKEDLKEAQKLSKESKQNERLEDEEKQGNDAAKDMQQSEESLEQKQNSKAKKSQSEASKNLASMAKSLRKKASGMDMEQIEIDIKATRQILSNLIRLSFDQEDLMDKVAHTSTATQAYISNQEEQNRLHSNSLMIRDSLFQLSKRVEKLPVIVNKETTALEQNMKRTVDALENRNINVAITDQQYVMTHTNNLALMLNEILANLMQMQGQAKEPGGDGSCTKPGGSTPKPGAGKQLSDIITEQQQLGESMQKMQKQGQKPGGSEGQKKGNTPQNSGSQGGQGEGNNEYGDAEQLARMAEQQAAIRRKIQELSSMLNSKGLGNSKELREIEQKMDKTETDLVNRKMSSDLMYRQKEIQVRLLEVEKSLREQEQDDKRSSRSAQEMTRPVPPALQKYITDQRQLLELYKTVPPQLKPYYRDMVENYFSIIGK
jgi:hypothetical protein